MSNHYVVHLKLTWSCMPIVSQKKKREKVIWKIIKLLVVSFSRTGLNYQLSIISSNQNDNFAATRPYTWVRKGSTIWTFGLPS